MTTARHRRPRRMDMEAHRKVPQMVTALLTMVSLTGPQVDMVLRPQTTMDLPTMDNQTGHPMDMVLQPQTTMDLPAMVNPT